MNDRRTQSNLISLCIIDLDPRVDDKRRALHRLLVEVALYENRPEWCQLDAIRTAISEILEQADAVPGDVILSTLEIAVQEGTVVSDSTRGWRLDGKRLDDLEASVQALELQRTTFFDGLILAIERRLPKELGSDDRKSVCVTVERFLQSVIYAEVVELSAGNTQLEDLVSRHPEGHLTETIDDELKRAFSEQVGHLAVSQIAAGVRDYFRVLPESGSRYLESLQLRVLGGQLLYLDPDYQRQLRQLFKRRKLFLDTNVLMAWFFDADDQHDLVPEVLSASLILGCNLFVTPETVAEFQGQINQARQQYARIRGSRFALSLGPQFNNVILRTFFRRQRTNPHLEWEAFISLYQSIEPYLFAKEVLVEGLKKWNDQLEARVSEVGAVLLRYKQNSTESAISHDASNLVAVDHMRADSPTDEFGCQVWLLTLDHALLRAQRDLQRRFAEQGAFSLPVSAHVSHWGTRIAKYQNALTFVYDDYISYLVRSKLGLVTSENHGISADFLELLTQAVVEVDELLSLPEEVVRGVIVALQEDSAVSDLLWEVLEADESLKEVKRQEFLARLERTVSTVQHEYERQSDIEREKMASRIEALEHELAAKAPLEAEVEELRQRLLSLEQTKDAEISRVLQQLEHETSKSILARILERFGLKVHDESERNQAPL